ncbi:unnamed protein product [Meloidogyne enterolobii]|uniref:Uncharacterized protein n=1 Tax=Meloidogyne enterolobii TaxID=390850 RepID=A0ACB1A412_MELEN
MRANNAEKNFCEEWKEFFMRYCRLGCVLISFCSCFRESLLVEKIKRNPPENSSNIFHCWRKSCRHF